MTGLRRLLPLLALWGLDACGDVKPDPPGNEPLNLTTAKSSAPQSRPSRDTVPQALLDTLRYILRQRNPAIDNVAFPQIQWFDYGRRYVAIGWGIRADRNFAGSFEDELYGFFVLDGTLTGVRKVLDIVPTPRWLDYRFRIEELTGDSIIITGRGDTYSDGPVRKAYAWPSTR